MKRLFNLLCNNQNALLNERFKVPIFKINSTNIFVIRNPTEFYDTLRELSENAQKRISISSLYIGTDHLEKALIDSFASAKTNNPDLDLNILLDHNRANRETINKEKKCQSSRSILLPLVNQGARVNFYLTHKLSGLHRYFWRKQKWNELKSLHHMKLYIFDDNIIISGANLSDLYFTNRQDRYILIRDSPSLCDYFDQLIKTISKFSLELQPNGSFKLQDNWKFDPRKYFHQYSFKNEARKVIEKFNQEFEPVNAIDSDTIVFPLLQMKTIGIKDEEKFTSCLMECPLSNSKLDIATGYFNLIKKYQNKLIAYSKNNNENTTILMASEKANGFYNGKGLLRFVPSVYTYYVRNFLQRISDKSNLIIRYYDRDEWSFHGKGIWWMNDKFFLTMVGSTNLGYRSVYRDNEAQIIILTNNDRLKKDFQSEYQDLVNYSRIINNEKQLPNVPYFVTIIARIYRSFF